MRAHLSARHRSVMVALVAAALAFPLGVVANHQFTDVPTSSTYHADIDAIRDAGITTGCAVGKYCPKDFVTREQMAAFLNRLGALQAGKTPVVNATKLDGLDAGSLTRVAYSLETSSIFIQMSETVYGTLTITAPTAGYVLVTTVTTIRNDTCTANCNVFGYLRHAGAASASTYTNTTVVAGARYANLNTTAVFNVAAGANSFEVILTKDAGANGNMQGFWGMHTAHFSAFAGGNWARTGDGGAATSADKR